MSPQRRVKHRALSQTNTHILSHVLFGHGRKCLNALCNVMNFTKLIAFSTQSYFQNRTSAIKFSVGKTIIHLNTSHNCIYQSVCYLKLAQCSWSWKQTKVCLKKWTAGSGRDFRYKNGWLIQNFYHTKTFRCGDRDERPSRLNFEQLFRGHSKDFLNTIISYDGTGYFRKNSIQAGEKESSFLGWHRFCLNTRALANSSRILREEAGGHLLHYVLWWLSTMS